MSRRVAIYGGSFNPPCVHHRVIVSTLAEHFDEVIVVPCGPRPDKPTTNDVAPVARAAMVDINFGDMPNVRVELFDLEQASFTRTHELAERFAHEGETWIVVGTKLVRGGADGKSFIQRTWERGEEIWQNLRFAVVVREDEELNEDDLPPQHQLFRPPCRGTSKTVREAVFHHQSTAGLVISRVAAYIERCWLYRGRLPVRSMALQIPRPRLCIVADERNDKALELAEMYRHLENLDDPNCICVFGGDGTMLRAIRDHWRKRLPFLGVNAGHRGFLLNGCEDFEDGKFPKKDLTIQQSPLLYIETENEEGSRGMALAFNDVWVERASSQTAWVNVCVDGEQRLKRMMGDGILVATAAGSTAYARAMGATPLLIDNPALILVGSNVMEPPGWNSALLSLDAQVEFRAVNSKKRPLVGFADGRPLGDVKWMSVRLSRIAAAELVFCSGHDIVEKIAQLQFPATK